MFSHSWDEISHCGMLKIRFPSLLLGYHSYSWSFQMKSLFKAFPADSFLLEMYTFSLSLVAMYSVARVPSLFVLLSQM
jgi:hypothetical protein